MGKGPEYGKSIPSRRSGAASFDLGDSESRIINGCKQSGLDKYIDHFESTSRTQSVKDTSNGVPPPHLHDKAGQIRFQEFRQVLSTVDANKLMEARSLQSDVKWLRNLWVLLIGADAQR